MVRAKKNPYNVVTQFTNNTQGIFDMIPDIHKLVLKRSAKITYLRLYKRLKIGREEKKCHETICITKKNIFCRKLCDLNSKIAVQFGDTKETTKNMKFLSDIIMYNSI